MKRLYLSFLILLLVIQAQAQESNVYINRQPLSPQILSALQQQGTVIPPGSYWYDSYCGAWGREGGGTLGFTRAGLNFGPLPVDISSGNTGVFVNGRHLPQSELYGIQALTGPVRRGYYWVDAQGNCGFVGGPAICNLRALAANRGGLYRQGSGVGQTYSNGGGAYRNSYTGIGVITDGSGGAFISK